ncbi:hypothetical protein QM012_007564 [Aureobasidium pullulans]|uniref:Altered inheritance of mitochondria protein 6 n=1 Tax=Aureobasidium pullulans TaxID=5580 RepID=A0ABR0TNK4_AURPU
MVAIPVQHQQHVSTISLSLNRRQHLYRFQTLYIRLTRPFTRSNEDGSSIDTSSSDLEQHARPLEEVTKSRLHTPNVAGRLRPSIRVLYHSFVLITGVLLIACICLSVLLALLSSGLRRIPDDDFDYLFGPPISAEDPSIWNDDHQAFIRNVQPVPLHSHNDYWRRIPLFEALGSGCISVEADIHLRNSDLLVGHKSSQLHPKLDLRNMYLDPLERMLRARNDNRTIEDWQGIFSRASKQTVVLLVDHKTAGVGTHAMLSTQLQPLRDLGYLTHWNGTARILRPLTIVATGNAPFYNDNVYRDIFFDADLGHLTSAHDTADHYFYNISNSYYASRTWDKALSRDARTRSRHEIASQIEAAELRGLLARYWNTPAKPLNMRDMVWRTLVEQDVGVLNMDDMGIVRDRAIGWGTLSS